MVNPLMPANVFFKTLDVFNSDTLGDALKQIIIKNEKHKCLNKTVKKIKVGYFFIVFEFNQLYPDEIINLYNISIENACDKLKYSLNQTQFGKTSKGFVSGVICVLGLKDMCIYSQKHWIKDEKLSLTINIYESPVTLNFKEIEYHQWNCKIV